MSLDLRPRTEGTPRHLVTDATADPDNERFEQLAGEPL